MLDCFETELEAMEAQNNMANPAYLKRSPCSVRHIALQGCSRGGWADNRSPNVFSE